VHFFDEEQSGRSVKKRLRSRGMMTGGIALTAAGPALVVVGLLSSIFLCGRDDTGSKPCDTDQRMIWFGLGGAALVGVGVPLIIIGAKRVPVSQVAIAPWVSPRNAGLALRLDL